MESFEEKWFWQQYVARLQIFSPSHNRSSSSLLSSSIERELPCTNKYMYWNSLGAQTHENAALWSDTSRSIVLKRKKWYFVFYVLKTK